MRQNLQFYVQRKRSISNIIYVDIDEMFKEQRAWRPCLCIAESDLIRWRIM